MSHIAFVVEPPQRKPVITETSDINQIYIPSYIKLTTDALLKRGHSIDIYNNVAEEIIIDGAKCKPIDKNPKNNRADLIIFHNGAQELSSFTFNKAAIWQHNRTSFVKAWKRKELIALWRYRPDVICLSSDALNKTPRWIPYKNKHLIPHGIHENYLTAANSRLENRKMQAYFASRPSRNLDFVIQAWEQHVYPNLPEAKLIICGPSSNKAFSFNMQRLKESNIHYIGSLNQSDLIRMMNESRILCYPGHINETGCRVALDAIGLGIPIVTCGIGSLKDLVTHNRTGFIETDPKNYALRVIECMTNDSLWKTLSRATLQHPWRQSYDQNATIWENTFSLQT